MASACVRVIGAGGASVLLACSLRHSTPSPRPPPAPAASPAFRVVGNASPSDTGAPTLLLADRMVTIRGMDLQRTDGGLYGDVDSTERGTLRLTLFDSVPGRTVQDATPAPGWLQVLYEARLGPLPSGPYDVWVGRWDPGSKTIIVTHQPLHIEVP
jgi:hypothetical protein